MAAVEKGVVAVVGAEITTLVLVVSDREMTFLSAVERPKKHVGVGLAVWVVVVVVWEVVVVVVVCGG